MIPEIFKTGIKCLCIDASSMIYHLRIGLLGSLAAEVELISTPQVLEEVGWPHLPVRAVQLENNDITNDDSLLLLAQIHRVPLLSEDRKLLMKADKLGLEYFNTLMMLNYLFMKGRVEDEDYPKILESLSEYAHYSTQVLEYGSTVYEEIKK
ncbi:MULTISPECIES: hypothetical protein [unclassified Oceanispirochaeta]|uniref:hypothetical protein n=1 Tax=unclassified Oceanispirochaeta TaxID=2635722 RepID=UPI000E09CFD4|nr:MULTISPECIES: hypothetical protein [unclassified Oceanispirochaeta]MBF9014428.1 hypothetical protein [Oceanispirochaeta sp. M2]NPD74982.1 hypothetical protein [Oceanispirochaeta sp. M1]RDG29158.1 hypothetical protein DV872_23070 [Oceanispirochaeta sp. M1]